MTDLPHRVTCWDDTPLVIEERSFFPRLRVFDAAHPEREATGVNPEDAHDNWHKKWDNG